MVLYRILFLLLLEFQAGFSCAVSQFLDSAVIQVAASVEDYSINALFQSFLTQSQTNQLSSFLVAAVCSLGLDFLVQGRCSDQGVAGGVINNLSGDILKTSVNAKSGAFGSSGNFKAYSCMSFLSVFIFLCVSFMVTGNPSILILMVTKCVKVCPHKSNSL